MIKIIEEQMVCDKCQTKFSFEQTDVEASKIQCPKCKTSLKIESTNKHKILLTD